MTKLERHVSGQVAHDLVADVCVLLAELDKVITAEHIHLGAVLGTANGGRSQPHIDQGHLAKNLTLPESDDGLGARGGKCFGRNTPSREIDLGGSGMDDIDLVAWLPLTDNDVPCRIGLFLAYRCDTGKLLFRQTDQDLDAFE